MELTKDWLLGKFNPAEHAEFAEVPAHLCDEPGHYLVKPAIEAWSKLFEAAKNDGIELTIISSTRTFERQKQIWENKWNGRTLTNGIDLSASGFTDEQKAAEILKYSAMPGTSRHHWGTDLDFNSVENDYFKTERGIREFFWMQMRAFDFGFCRPYCDLFSRGNKGYQEEKWHWSYVPLSKKFLKSYLAQINYTELTGFDGSNTATSMHVIEDYIESISNNCK
jgi:D-alanyl-D-alanine carboxypeptidase